MNNEIHSLAYKFGKRIKFERIKRDLTQEQLAEMAKIGRTTITNLERNTSSPTLDVVEKLAKALGYEPHELLIFKDLEI
jgi:transcriptional regulator with XRE-family HTH domain